LKSCDNYKVHQAFFKTCGPELLFEAAAAHCFPNSLALEATIEKKTGYSRKKIGSFAKRVRRVGEEIARFNSLPLPGEETFMKVLEDFGDVSPGMEESTSVSARLNSLPSLLAEYNEALKKWPHPTYRRLLSERNWGAYRLVQLCLYVKAVTGDFHYDEIADLLTAVAEFGEVRLNEPPSENPITADLIRHNVNSFRERNPRVYERTEIKARFVAARYEEQRSSA
jgi:hypothetical protein